MDNTIFGNGGTYLMKNKSKIAFDSVYNELISIETNEQRMKKIILPPLLMSLLIFFVIQNMMYETALKTRTCFFTLICALMWVGIFNSIQTISGKRQNIRNRFFDGMSMPIYLLGNVFYQLRICLIQTLIVYLCFILMIGFNNEGVLGVSFIEYLLLFFLILFSSDMLGLLISTFSKDNVTAMTVMPFFLVAEMIFSNALFELESKILDIVSLFMISRWGVDGLGVIENILTLPESSLLKQTSLDFPKITYEFSTSHFLSIVLVLILFSITYILIAIYRLNRIDKG